MKSTDPFQLPGFRQLAQAFILLVVLMTAFDAALQWLSLSLHHQALLVPELIFPMSLLTALF